MESGPIGPRSVLAGKWVRAPPETPVLTLCPILCPVQMSNKRSNSFRQAILQGNRRLCSKALLEEKGLNLSQRLIRHVAYETLPREIDRKWYYDSYTCCPPPWFMITVTVLEARTSGGGEGVGREAAGGSLRSRGEGQHLFHQKIEVVEDQLSFTSQTCVPEPASVVLTPGPQRYPKDDQAILTTANFPHSHPYQNSSSKSNVISLLIWGS